MAAAVAAAVAAGKELYLPAGILRFNMHGLGIAGAIPLTSSIVIRGAGRGKTVLKCDGFVEGTFTPHTDTILAANDNSATLFKRTAGTHSVTLSDMTLQGPDEAELTGDLNNVWAVWSGGGGGLTMERVEMRMWCQCVKMSPEYPVYPGN